MTRYIAEKLELLGDTVYTHDGDKILRCKVLKILDDAIITDKCILWYEDIRQLWSLTIPKAIELLRAHRSGKGG
jgi:hypothetical protein